jgi:hypothetical protein
MSSVSRREMSDQDNELIHLTIDVVVALEGRNNMRPEEVPEPNRERAQGGLQTSGQWIDDFHPSRCRAE